MPPDSTVPHIERTQDLLKPLHRCIASEVGASFVSWNLQLVTSHLLTSYWLWSTTNSLPWWDLQELEIVILPSNAGGFLDGFFQAFTWPWNARLGSVLHSVLFDMELMRASHIALKTNLLAYISPLLNVPTSQSKSLFIIDITTYYIYYILCYGNISVQNSSSNYSNCNISTSDLRKKG